MCQTLGAALGREIGEKVKKLDRKMVAGVSGGRCLCDWSCAEDNPRYM